ncbi:hypothetical protein CH373_15045 [Leptospira perolatii]|uniref:Uncharacterized protein n=1 Tax=Leptospira perolatii TaxID=2023191 RepID=A0A2M9ZJL2_9LEPT|nr:hypothetical protein [Leptospira perolatii]PJZ68585.1 hypothetical protein CH360_15500 [Leptospira perolatii]PJZ72240.1 hypothetical protein CH373_15045 [Leptospira perolatii]
MNVNSIQGSGFHHFSARWSPPEIADKQEARKDPLQVSDLSLAVEKQLHTGKSKPNIEELVMKPSPVTTEERLSQVISAEQMKNLLSMMVRSKFSGEQKHQVSGHRLDQKG